MRSRAGEGRRRGPAFADHAQGADLRSDGRHRVRRDEVASREDRRRAELGLPHLLAARCDLRSVRAARVAATATKPPPGREWLLRVVAGKASQLNILYGITGERRLTEITLDWLPGYENSAPVRIGNAAYQQFQLDVFGENHGRPAHLAHPVRPGRRRPTAGRVLREMLEFSRSPNGGRPDDGIWEPRRSPAALHTLQSHGLGGVRPGRPGNRGPRSGGPHRPLAEAARRDPRRSVPARLRRRARRVRAVVRIEGARRQSADDAAQVGFLPASDPRIRGTVDGDRAAICSRDGFVARYCHSRAASTAR